MNNTKKRNKYLILHFRFMKSNCKDLVLYYVITTEKIVRFLGKYRSFSVLIVFGVRNVLILG
jgi:hypothetical protein